MLLCWDSQAWEILLTPFKSGVSVSYSPPALPNISLAVFESQPFGDLIFLVQDPRLGAWCGAQTPHSSGMTSAVVIFFLLVNHQPRVWSLLESVSTSLTHLMVAPSLYVYLQKIFSAGLYVILRVSCSVNICNFGVPMGGGELRVFLLCHLDPPAGLCFLYGYFLIQHFKL